jgi:hypothetical protein
MVDPSDDSYTGALHREAVHGTNRSGVQRLLAPLVDRARRDFEGVSRELILSSMMMIIHAHSLQRVLHW